MRWLSKKEVCQLFSVARATIDRWVGDPDYEHLGFPKPFRIEGCSRVFFREEQVLEWKAKREAMLPSK